MRSPPLYIDRRRNQTVIKLADITTPINRRRFPQRQGQGGTRTHHPRHPLLRWWGSSPRHLRQLRPSPELINGQNRQETLKTGRSVGPDQIHRIHNPRTVKETNRIVSLQNPTFRTHKRRKQGVTRVLGSHGHQTTTGQRQIIPIDKLPARILPA
jgi:hypothetical protein